MLNVVWKLLDTPGVWRRVQACAGWYTVRAYRRTAMELLRLTGSEAVLDVGCGTGEYSQLLRHRRYVGVDFNEKYVEWAQQAYGQDSRSSFYAMDVADVPKLNIPLDAAVCVGVTHHLSSKELHKLVADVLAAVSVRFVIVDMVLPPVWRNPLSHLLVRMDRGRHGRSKEALLQALRDTGAIVESVSETFGFPHSVVGISLRRKARARE